MSGHGELILPTGENYKGTFRDGVYHGIGERSWTSGALSLPRIVIFTFLCKRV